MVALAMGDLEPDPEDPQDPRKKRIRLNPQDREKWTADALQQRIRLMGNKHIIACFLNDRWNIESGNHHNGLWSYRVPKDDDNRGTGLLGISVRRVRTLVEGNLTLAEKCMLQYAIGKTVSICPDPAPEDCLEHWEKEKKKEKL